MQNDSKTASSSSTATTGDSQPPTEPVVLFDAEKNELKISVPYVPEYLSVTLWGTLGGNPTAPPAPAPATTEGVPVKPPKEIKVLILESESGVWPDPEPKT